MEHDLNKIETLDDIRAIMNDPEVKAANKAFSKKYLKANRAKSIAVVIISLAAFCGILSLSRLNAASVTPPALRTADAVSVVWQDETQTGDPVTLTAYQQKTLIELLSDTPVERLLNETAEESVLPAVEFSMDGKSFSIVKSGKLYVDGSVYGISDAEALWTKLETILNKG